MKYRGKINENDKYMSIMFFTNNLYNSITYVILKLTDLNQF